jgi:hypothetical protein
MKTAVYKSNYRSAVPYPNAATRRETFHEALDTLLIAASGMGLAATLLLMTTLL